MTSEKPSVPPSGDRPCCEEFAQRISDMHDGRWPPQSRECAEVEEHLATCPRCAELLDGYRLISRAAAALRAVEVGAECAETMRRRVRARLRGRVFRRRLAWTGAGVAVAAAASVAVAVAMLPDADAPAQGRSGPVADGAAPPGPQDLLRNPAVAALLRELEAETLRDADARPGDALTVQEEIDLRRDWGVYPVREGDLRAPGFRPVVFPDWRVPWRRQPGGTEVVPVVDEAP